MCLLLGFGTPPTPTQPRGTLPRAHRARRPTSNATRAVRAAPLALATVTVIRACARPVAPSGAARRRERDPDAQRRVRREDLRPQERARDDLPAPAAAGRQPPERLD